MRIAVARDRVDRVAVVEVVVDGRREDAIETEDVGRRVPLVLVPAAPRDLDDDLDDVGVRAAADGLIGRRAGTGWRAVRIVGV